MDDLVSDFIAETREGLEALDGELVHFERHPQDPALIGGIFRLIHTIKGTCGFLGLTRLQTVAHAAENVLGAFRDGELAVTPNAVSAILETVDVIRGLIDALGSEGAEPAGDDSGLIARLEDALRGEVAQVVADPEVVVATEEAATRPDTRPLIDRLGGDATLDAACEMILDDLQDEAFGGAFAGADRDRLQATLRDGLCAAARGSGGGADFERRIATMASGGVTHGMPRRILDLIVEVLPKLESAPSAVDELLSRLVAEESSVAVVAPGQVEPEVAAEPICDVEPAVTSKVPLGANPSNEAEPAKPAPTPVVQAVQPASGSERPEGDVANVNQTIRVSVDSLEHLMTVVSELVLIRNQLIQTLRLDPESPFAAPLNRLNQVTSELQEGVMTTRMQPISGAWAKLPRLVRDLARDLGKQIDLSMVGQETELDRQVLELIKDPLTHMIRNAVDHGLETPAERRAAGKPDAGRIMLAARHEGGAIVIEVGDDGRGLPAAKIRAKALASGIVSATDLDAMSDADVMLARNPDFVRGYAWKAMGFMMQKRFPEAIEAQKRAYAIDPNPGMQILLAMTEAAGGNKPEAERLVHRIEEIAKQQYVCNYEIAQAYSVMGDTEHAMKWLHSGLSQQCDCMIWLQGEPWMESLRADPRYLDLIRRVGFDRVPKGAGR